MPNVTNLGSAVVPIWPPNWSQAFPDFLNALATGIAVAVVVLIIDRIRSKREARERALEDWERLKPHLRPLFRLPDLSREEFYVISNQGIRVPGWIVDIAGYVGPFPLPRWTKLLSDPAVPALARLERTTSVLVQVGTDYNNQLQGLASEVVSRGTDPGSDWFNLRMTSLGELMSGELLGVELPARSWDRLVHLGGEAPAEEMLSMLREDPRLADGRIRIPALLAQLEVDYQTVRSAVIR